MKLNTQSMPIVSNILGASFESRADYLKAWRKIRWSEYHRNWHKQHPIEARARNILSGAIYRGKVIRPQSCESCGIIGPVQGHHADYSKPLEVKWLCRLCHLKTHS